MWPSFQYYLVILVPVCMSFYLLLFSLFYSMGLKRKNIKNLVMWTLYACLMEIFKVGHVDPLYERYSELVMWTLYACFIKYSELVMWMLYACLIKVFRVGHGDPLCMFNKIFRVGHVDTLFKIFRVGHVDPLCMFNKLFSELVMWTLYACLINYFQSWSCGPSIHV